MVHSVVEIPCSVTRESLVLHRLGWYGYAYIVTENSLKPSILHSYIIYQTVIINKMHAFFSGALTLCFLDVSTNDAIAVDLTVLFCFLGFGI